MNLLPKAITLWASRLKFPQLFFFFLVIFLLDLFIPDFIPFVDELLFGLITLMLAMWKKRKQRNQPEVVQEVEDIEPR
ncbi:MAG: DUF6116 family protein [Bacteroidota bacterium]